MHPWLSEKIIEILKQHYIMLVVEIYCAGVFLEALHMRFCSEGDKFSSIEVTANQIKQKLTYLTSSLLSSHRSQITLPHPLYLNLVRFTKDAPDR